MPNEFSFGADRVPRLADNAGYQSVRCPSQLDAVLDPMLAYDELYRLRITRLVFLLCGWLTTILPNAATRLAPAAQRSVDAVRFVYYCIPNFPTRRGCHDRSHHTRYHLHQG